MNNDLNMQLIEQLTTATLGKSLDVKSYCQMLFDLLKTHIKNLSGLTFYQRQDEVFVDTMRFPPVDNKADNLTRESHESVLTAVTANQIFKDSSQVYLPIQNNNAIYGVLHLRTDEDNPQIASINWSVLSKIVTREIQHILQGTLEPPVQVDDRIRVQQALNELSTFANTHQDERSLLNQGAETILKLLDIDHVGIMMIDEDGEYANLVTDNPPSETSIRRIPVEGETWDKLAKGEHIRIDDTSTASDIATSSKQSLEAIGAKSSLFLPFRDVSDKLIGSIGLDTINRSLKLSAEQIQIANLVIGQLVTQLQNLRLIQGSQRLANQMQQIAKYSETVQSRLQLEEILQTTLHFVDRILAVDYAAIVLYDETAQKLIVKAYHLEDKDKILPSDTPIMPAKDTLVGQVWTTREAGYIRRLADSPYHNPIAPKIESLYAIPLIARGKILGSIEVGANDHGINRTDRDVLSQLTNQLAVALENANAYVQSQRLAENKALASEIALQLQQQMDMDSLLNTTVTELGKALGAKRARIRLGVHQTVSNN